MVLELLPLGIKGFESESALKEKMSLEKKSKTDNLLSIIKKKEDISPEEQEMIKGYMNDKLKIQKEVSDKILKELKEKPGNTEKIDIKQISTESKVKIEPNLSQNSRKKLTVVNIEKALGFDKNEEREKFITSSAIQAKKMIDIYLESAKNTDKLNSQINSKLEADPIIETPKVLDLKMIDNEERKEKILMSYKIKKEIKQDDMQYLIELIALSTALPDRLGGHKALEKLELLYEYLCKYN